MSTILSILCLRTGMELSWAPGQAHIRSSWLALLLNVYIFHSHEEPMMRSIPSEWGLFGVGPWDYNSNAQNIYNFWVNGTERAKPYESMFTIGMRGNGDRKRSFPIWVLWAQLRITVPLSVGTDIDLLEQVVSDQRQILSDVFNGTNVTTIPQMWALCESSLFKALIIAFSCPRDSKTKKWRATTRTGCGYRTTFAFFGPMISAFEGFGCGSIWAEFV